MKTKGSILTLLITILSPLLLTISATLICAFYVPEFERIGENYFNSYCLGWANNLTFNSDPNWFEKGKVDIDNDVDSIMCFAYGGGWEVWNTQLHKTNGTIPEELKGQYVQTQIGIAIRFWYELRLFKTYDVELKYDDYEFLEKALNKCVCGKITTYHGMEGNELEMFDQISSLLDINDPEYTSWRDNKDLFANKDLTKLENATLNYDAFCATSLNKNIARDFLVNEWNGGYHNVIFYEINIDEHVYGAYISSKKSLFYGIPMAWPYEYQILLSCKLKLKINSAHIEKTASGKNVLYLKTKAFHEELVNNSNN